MIVATEFVPNPKWLPSFMESSELEEIVAGNGAKVLAAAEGFAAEHVESGEFLESLKLTTGHYRTGRPYARVSSDDPAALSIEFGTANNAAQRVLGRAIRTI